MATGKATCQAGHVSPRNRGLNKEYRGVGMLVRHPVGF